MTIHRADHIQTTQEDTLSTESLTLDEYQKRANQTSGLRDEISSVRLLMGSMGVSGEAGEVLDTVKKLIFHKHPYDRDKIVEELGDVLYYVAEIASAVGVQLSTVAILRETTQALWRLFLTREKHKPTGIIVTPEQIAQHEKRLQQMLSERLPQLVWSVVYKSSIEDQDIYEIAAVLYRLGTDLHLRSLSHFAIHGLHPADVDDVAKFIQGRFYEAGIVFVPGV